MLTLRSTGCTTPIPPMCTTGGTSTSGGDPLGRIVADPRHSSEEGRYVLLGLSEEKRLLVVMFVDRGEGIRIISARPATRREQRDYEEATE